MTRRPARRRLLPTLDSLPPRLLPASGVTAFVSQGVLSVQGTENNDRLNFTARARAGRRGHGVIQVIVSVNGVRRWRAKGVENIVVAAGGGADLVTLAGRAAPWVSLSVDGGAGDDTLIGNHGNDTLLGGEGNDQIWGGPGQNHCDGGAGTNLVDGTWDTPAPPTTPPQPIQVNPTPTPPPTSTPTPTPSPPPVDLDTIARQLVDLVNMERRDAGLGTLTINDKLMQAAQIHADDMARLDRMEHDLPGAALPGLKDRADYVGYVFSWLGENIAFNYPDAGSVHFAWMNSPGHRANILGSQFTEIGVALARNARGELYFCQVFGRPGG